MPCIEGDRKVEINVWWNVEVKLWVWWNYKFVSEISFSENCGFDSRGDLINTNLGQNGSKLVFHVPIVTERWKSIIKINWGKLFLLEPLSQNLEVLTPCCEVINLKNSQKGPNWYSCTNADR